MPAGCGWEHQQSISKMRGSTPPLPASVERRERDGRFEVRSSSAPHAAIRPSRQGARGFLRKGAQQECQGGLHAQQNAASVAPAVVD